MFPRGLALAAFVLAGALGGCASPEAAEDRAVIGAIDALRRESADDLPSRMKLVDALEKLPASTERARRARDVCAEAYRLLVAGKESAAKAERALANPKEASKTVLVELGRAEEKIRKSEEVMPRCDEAAAELRLSRR